MGGLFKHENTAYAPGELAPPVTVTERREPPAPVQVGVVVLSWLVLLAALIGAAIGGLATETGKGAGWGAVVGAVLMLLFCLWRLIPVIEVMWGIDINGDKNIGPVQPPKQVERVHKFKLDTPEGGRWFDLPEDVSYEHFVRMCKKFLIDRTAEGHHQGMRDELALVRDMLMDHNLAVWKAAGGNSKNNGWTLTPMGRKYCKQVIADYSPIDDD
jgi:hypothetical protein